MKTITKVQIQAVGDNTITWIESKFTGIVSLMLKPALEQIRAEWDTVGVAKVAQLLTDLGWQVP